MNIWAFLLAAAWPLAKKILTSLGIGVLTYQGLTLVAQQLESAIVGAWGQVGGVTLQILSLAGIPQALGILIGGFTAKAALVAIGRIGRVAA